MKNIKNLILPLFLLGILFCSCEPQLDDKLGLGDLPTGASFEISPLEADNTYLLRSTTEGAFINSWDLGDKTTATGREVEVTYVSAGSYDVQLTIATSGGSAVSEIQTILVNEDLPVDCETSPLFKFLTNCDQRSWSLVSEEGALWVGPDAGTTWFQTSEDDITGRPCAWNDEWIFSTDRDMTYDTKGDIWAEDYMGFNFECIDENLLSEQIRPWGSGVHGFVVEDKTAVPTLTVVGLGAYIGLPKATNGAEVGFPVSSVTYDVTAFEQQADRYFLELQVNFGPGNWRFRLESEL